MEACKYPKLPSSHRRAYAGIADGRCLELHNYERYHGRGEQISIFSSRHP